MNSSYTFNLENGKYTGIIDYTGGGLTFLRYGERWPGANHVTGSKVVTAMAHRIEELEQAISDVLNGTRDEHGRRCRDGMYSRVHGAELVETEYVENWTKCLSKALEQRP